MVFLGDSSVTLLNSKLSTGSGFLPAHHVVVLGKALYSHSDSLHLGEEMDTGELSAKPDKM